MNARRVSRLCWLSFLLIHEIQLLWDVDWLSLKSTARNTVIVITNIYTQTVFMSVLVCAHVGMHMCPERLCCFSYILLTVTCRHVDYISLWCIPILASLSWRWLGINSAWTSAWKRSVSNITDCSATVVCQLSGQGSCALSVLSMLLITAQTPRENNSHNKEWIKNEALALTRHFLSCKVLSQVLRYTSALLKQTQIWHLVKILPGKVLSVLKWNLRQGYRL